MDINYGLLCLKFKEPLIDDMSTIIAISANIHYLLYKTL